MSRGVEKLKVYCTSGSSEIGNAGKQTVSSDTELLVVQEVEAYSNMYTD